MSCDIYKTESFARTLEVLEKDEKEWVNKIVSKLKENPETGKPLRFPWFKEKKFKRKRLYFLVYDELNKILFVAFGNKKDQQKIIDSVTRNLDAYKKLAENL